MARILVVDDRSINREFLAALLDAVGHDVIEAEGGQEALDLARKARPELVITDLMMPGMDGLELTSRLHLDPATSAIPIVFYTATYRVHEAREMARTHGVSLVLPKPSEPQVILAAIEQVLGARGRATREPAASHAPLPGRFGSLGKLQQRLYAGLDAQARGTPAPPDATTAVHALSLRLAAVLELSLALGSEPEPARLLELFSRATQDILGVRAAGVALFDGTGGRQLGHAASGIDAGAQAALAGIDLAQPFLAEVLAGQEPRIAAALGGDGARVGLPRSHPPVESVLVAPVRSVSGAHGVLYFADKLNGAPFGEEDVQFAATLAAQLALSFGNLMLLEESQRHAGELRLEVLERRRVAEELRASEARYRQLFDASPLPMWVYDLGTLEFLAVNDAAIAHYGYSREEFEAMSILDIRPDEERERLLRVLERLRATGATDDSGVWRHLKRDGSMIEVEVTAHRIDLGSRRANLVLAHDVTERLEQERKIARLSRIRAVTAGISSAMLRESRRDELLREACRVAATAGVFPVSWITTPDPATGLFELTAWHSEDPRAKEVVDIARSMIASEARPSARAARARRPVVINDIGTEHGLATVRARLLALGYRSGAAFPLLSGERVDAVWVVLATEPDFFDAEEVALLAELAEDLSFALAHIEQAARLEHLAYYDPVTDLANARLFGDRLDQFVFAARENRGGIAVVVLDLEHFTRINETLGRDAGDDVLRQVGWRLGGALREPYSLGRIAADTFAAASPRIGEDVATDLRDRLLGALAEPFAVGEDEVQVTAQAGIALYPADGADGGELFKAAEAALKLARSSGERFAYYSGETNARIAARAALERELRRAVELRQLVLHYQPRVDLLSGIVTGAEALIRWQHPERGLLLPAHFVALAEETGLIVPIGAWVIDVVCGQIAAWRSAGLALVPVAVNLSSVQFEQGDLLGSVQDALARHRVEPRLLELELTESVVMKDPAAAAKILRALRSLGVGLALDDFGTGYSSLAHLKRFPFNAVKIDRSFVTDLTTNAEDAAIATAIIAMAHRLQLRVVAEGVEREGQLNYLRSQGCDEMQGHLYAAAAPAIEFERLLQTGHRLAVPTAATDERTLLLVDDEQGVRNALFRALRRDGYRILMASGPSEAFELLSVNHVQVIVSDQRMPEMSGTEFLNTVKQLYPETVRIILSGYTDLQVVTESVNRGAVFKFLTKPWDDDLLREQVRDAFRRYQPAA